MRLFEIKCEDCENYTCEVNGRTDACLLFVRQGKDLLELLKDAQDLAEEFGAHL